MTESKSLVFFGTEDFSLVALKALVESGFGVVCVVTKPDAKRGRGQKLTPSLVKSYALKNNIDVIQSPSMDDVATKLDEYKTDVAVLSAFGRIIPELILSKYPLGIVNIHPSLLPRHRGASPMEQTLLSGDEMAGVSIMKLVNEMDAGPVYAQDSYQLDATENIFDLYEALGAKGAELLLQNLPAIMDGSLEPTEQDHSEATLAPMISKQDAEIDWSDSAENISRKIRAYARWPGVKYELRGQTIKLITAVPSGEKIDPGSAKSANEGVLIGCGDGSVLITELQPQGKRKMLATEFLAGNKII